MSQWANENPERMAEIAALPMGEQNAALREAMSSWRCPNGCANARPAWWPAPPGGRTPPCSNCDAPLEHEAVAPTEPTVTRECRNCGDPFPLAVRLAEKRPTKWTSLCPSCLADEL